MFFFDFGSCKNLRHDFLEVSCLVACTRSLFMLSDGMSSETTWGDSLPGSSAQWAKRVARHAWPYWFPQLCIPMFMYTHIPRVHNLSNLCRSATYGQSLNMFDEGRSTHTSLSIIVIEVEHHHNCGAGTLHWQHLGFACWWVGSFSLLCWWCAVRGLSWSCHRRMSRIRHGGRKTLWLLPILNVVKPKHCFFKISIGLPHHGKGPHKSSKVTHVF